MSERPTTTRRPDGDSRAGAGNGAGGNGNGGGNGRAGGSNRRVDPVTVSVIQGALENIATEMGHKLMRMSYSSIIRESEDFGAGLVDADGQGLAESAQSTPLQSGPIPGYVQGMLRQLAERGDPIRPGDVIMHNDAYAGASHGPDVAFIVPAFHRERLVGFAATTRPPPRYRRPHARELRHRGRHRRVRGGAPVQVDQGVRGGAEDRARLAAPSRQHPGFGPRGRRHGGPDRGLAHRGGTLRRPARALRARDGGGGGRSGQGPTPSG